MKQRYFVLKIQLLNIEPPIWRRFMVPDNITLDHLHNIIQIVMGWTDSHLYDFTIRKVRYTKAPESEEEGLNSGLYKLGDLINRKGSVFYYTYDFGDGWDHKLVLEDNGYSNPELKTLLACLGGERACPPEDIGGAYGYFEYYTALKNPNHENYKTYMEWPGVNFNPEKFDSKSINKELMNYFR